MHSSNHLQYLHLTIPCASESLSKEMPPHIQISSVFSQFVFMLSEVLGTRYFKHRLQQNPSQSFSHLEHFNEISSVMPLLCDCL